MSMRSEAKAERQRQVAWYEEMRRRGILVLGVAEYQALRDCVSLLALAHNRFPTPFDERDLREKILALYHEANEKLQKSAPGNGWMFEEPIEDGKAIYLSRARSDRGA